MKRLFLGLIVGALCGVSGCASITPAPVAGHPGLLIQATWTMKNGVPHLRFVEALPIEGLMNEAGIDETGAIVMREKHESDRFWRKNNGMAWGAGGLTAGLAYLAYDQNRSSGSSGSSTFVDQANGRQAACNLTGANVHVAAGGSFICDGHDSHDSSGP